MIPSSKFYKYIFRNLLSITFSLLCIFYGIYWLDQYKNSKEALNISYTSTAQDAARIIDDKLLSTLNMLNQTSISKTMYEFTDLTTYKPMVAVNTYNLFSQSVGLIPNLDFSLGVYNPNLDLVLSTLGSSNLEFFLGRFGLTQNSDALNFIHNKEMADHNLSSSFLLQSTSGDQLFYMIRKKNLPNEPLFFITFDIHSLLNSAVSSETPFKFDIILDYETTSNPIDFMKSSTVLPINYIAKFDVQKDSIFLSTSFKTLLPFCLLLVLGSALIYIFSKKLYLPVQKFMSTTLSLTPDTPIVDEFDYIQCHLKNLKDTIQAHKLCAHDILLKEIIYGIKKDNLKELLHTYNISTLNDSFFMLIITDKQPDRQSASLTQASIEESFSTLSGLNSFKVVTISSLTYIVFINAPSREEVFETLTSITSYFPTYLFILTNHLQLSDVSTKFYKLNQLIKNNDILNGSPLVLEEQIDIKAPLSYAFTSDNKKLLLYHLSTQNKTDFMSIANTILTENLIKQQLSREFSNQFISVICNLFQEFSPDLYDTQSLFQELTALPTAHELKDRMLNLFECYYEHFSQKNFKRDIQYRFLEYIHTHYDQDISLVDLAESFNLAINYVGVLFKEKTGYNFKDYLNTYRISMAKQILLTTPHIKIKDLSQAVGFFNINTFIRIFKKYEGISPGQYQKYILDNQCMDSIS